MRQSTQYNGPCISNQAPDITSLLAKSHPSIEEVVQNALRIPGATVHLYGKSESRPGRKMGHITIVGSSDAEVRARLRPLLLQLGVDEKNEINERLAPIPQHPRDPSYSDILKAKGGDFGSGSSAKKNSKYPLVGIIIGSDSDLPVMRDAAAILDGFGVEYELTIVSAHRTPERLTSYAKSAVSLFPSIRTSALRKQSFASILLNFRPLNRDAGFSWTPCHHCWSRRCRPSPWDGSQHDGTPCHRCTSQRKHSRWRR